MAIPEWLFWSAMGFYLVLAILLIVLVIWMSMVKPFEKLALRPDEEEKPP